MPASLECRLVNGRRTLVPARPLTKRQRSETPTVDPPHPVQSSPHLPCAAKSDHGKESRDERMRIPERKIEATTRAVRQRFNASATSTSIQSATSSSIQVPPTTRALGSRVRNDGGSLRTIVQVAMTLRPTLHQPLDLRAIPAHVAVDDKGLERPTSLASETRHEALKGLRPSEALDVIAAQISTMSLLPDLEALLDAEGNIAEGCTLAFWKVAVVVLTQPQTSSQVDRFLAQAGSVVLEKCGHEGIARADGD